MCPGGYPECIESLNIGISLGFFWLDYDFSSYFRLPAVRGRVISRAFTDDDGDEPRDYKYMSSRCTQEKTTPDSHTRYRREGKPPSTPSTPSTPFTPPPLTSLETINTCHLDVTKKKQLLTPTPESKHRSVMLLD